MKQRVEEMEREASKLRELQAAAEKSENPDAATDDAAVPMETDEDKAASDGRSIYVGNVRVVFVNSGTLSDPEMVFSSHIGGLWGDPRGNPATFPGLRDYQSGNYHLRQIHRSSKRVRTMLLKIF